MYFRVQTPVIITEYQAYGCPASKALCDLPLHFIFSLSPSLALFWPHRPFNGPTTYQAHFHHGTFALAVPSMDGTLPTQL